MVGKAIKSKNFKLIISFFLLLLISLVVDALYPRSFIEKFYSLASFYQTDQFVRNYVSSKDKGNTLFIGGSALFSNLSMAELNRVANEMGIKDFKAQALFLSGRTIQSQIFFIENILNDGQIKILVMDSNLMRPTARPITYHDATLLDLGRENFSFTPDNLSLLFSMSLLSLNNLFTRLFPILAEQSNQLSISELENFGQYHPRKGFHKDVQIEGEPSEVLWKPIRPLEVDFKSPESQQLQRFFSACRKRNILPILMIPNRHSRQMVNIWLAEIWNSQSQYPVLYVEPELLEQKFNIDYESLFEDRLHFSDATRDLYSSFFSKAFLKLIANEKELLSGPKKMEGPEAPPSIPVKITN